MIATYAFTNGAASTVILNHDGSQNVAAFPVSRFRNATDRTFRVAVTGSGLWLKLFGNAPVAASKGAGGELHFPAGTVTTFHVGPEWAGFAIIGEDATCKGSISIVDVG